MSISEEAIQLARRLAALPELSMRACVLVEYLSGTDPLQAVLTLNRIQALGRQAGPPFDIASLALAAVLTKEMLGYDLMARLYAAAAQEGLSELQRLFLSGRSEPGSPAAVGEERRELTLGHRKQMARGGGRNVLLRLMEVPEADVMPHLLQNPRLTERDVVYMAAKRPVDPGVLRHIFDSPRWISRYGVKRALVLNPHTPTDMSLRLLRFLVRGDLQLVWKMSNIPLPVKQAAEQMLRARGQHEGI